MAEFLDVVQVEALFNGALGAALDAGSDKLSDDVAKLPG